MQMIQTIFIIIICYSLCAGPICTATIQFLSSTFPARRIFRLIFLVRAGMKRSLFSGRGSFSSSGLCCHSDPRCSPDTHTHTKLTVCWCSSLGTPASSFAMSLFFNFGWIQDKKKGRKLVILYGSPKN